MKQIVAIIGDIHGDINKMYEYLAAFEQRVGIKLSLVIHVGDFGVYPKGTDFHQYWNKQRVAPVPTWVCPGNHEDWVSLQQWLREPDRMDNLHLLRDGEIDNVNGIRVGAIWGNFSYKSWMNPERIETCRSNHPQSRKATHIYKPSVERLKRAGEFDILITHDAPATLMKPMRQPDQNIKEQLGLDPDEKAQGCPGFNELYITGKPQFHFFGHFHTYYICKPGDPLVVCLHCFNYNKEQSVWVMDWGKEEWEDSIAGTAMEIARPQLYL